MADCYIQQLPIGLFYGGLLHSNILATNKVLAMERYWHRLRGSVVKMKTSKSGPEFSGLVIFDFVFAFLERNKLL